MQKPHQTESAKWSLTWYSPDTVRYIGHLGNLFRIFHLHKAEICHFDVKAHRLRRRAHQRVVGASGSIINKFPLR